MSETPLQTLESTQDTIPHPYHLVHPSPWPVVASLAAGVLAVGALFYLHDGPQWVLLFGFIGVLGVMGLWWRDVIKESISQNAHTSVVKIGLRYGMALFILSEVMFFFTFFWAVYDTTLFPKMVDVALFPEWVSPGQSLQAALNPNANWPPPGITVLDPFTLPLTMTVVLLLSGCTVTWAHDAIHHGHSQEVERALGLTILLGVLFLGLQTYEYNHLHFTLSDGIYPTTFYMATGFHGLHVLIGVIFLTVCWVRTMRGHFTSEKYFGLEAASWYWHFVDVVWLFLFTSIYWWGSIPR